MSVIFRAELYNTTPDNNGRIYPKEVLESFCNQLNDRISRDGYTFGMPGDMPGEMTHPDGKIYLNSVSHKIDNAVIENDELVISGEILDTDMGKRVQDCMKFGLEPIYEPMLYDGKLIAVNVNLKPQNSEQHV